MIKKCLKNILNERFQLCRIFIFSNDPSLQEQRNLLSGDRFYAAVFNFFFQPAG